MHFLRIPQAIPPILFLEISLKFHLNEKLFLEIVLEILFFSCRRISSGIPPETLRAIQRGIPTGILKEIHPGVPPTISLENSTGIPSKFSLQ